MPAASVAGEILSKALVVGAVAGVLALSRKYFAPSKEDVEVSEEVDTYLPNVILINACMILIGVFLAFGIHTALVAVNRLLAARDGIADIVLYPSSAIWWFLPGFAAVCLSWEITLQLWSLFSPSQAKAYRAYTTLKSGFDSTRVLRWMAILLVFSIAVATILALPIHTTLTPTEIRDGHFATLRETIYPYAEATSLTLFDRFGGNGSFTPRAGILIRFHDGRTFNTADTDDPNPTVDSKLRELLIRKTGLQIQHVRIQP